MGIFDLNENVVVVKEPFMGSNLYYIDDFYKNPDSILEFFSKQPLKQHTPGRHMDTESFNGIYFDDERISVKTDEISKVWNHLSDICGQVPVDTNVLTNHFRFRDKNFNKSNDILFIGNDGQRDFDTVIDLVNKLNNNKNILF